MGLELPAFRQIVIIINFGDCLSELIIPGFSNAEILNLPNNNFAVCLVRCLYKNRLVLLLPQAIKLGRAFDSSGGFTLPNRAVRSPDVTWIEKSKLADVSAGVKFPRVIPDFVIELRPDTDRMPKLREKMEEYRANGVRLGWLIDPQKQQVEIYRLGQDVEAAHPHQSERRGCAAWIHAGSGFDFWLSLD